MGIKQAICVLALAGAAALALGACQPKNAAEQNGASSSAADGGMMGGVFPRQRTPYKALYQVGGEAGREMTMYFTPGKMRSEATVTSGMTAVTLIDRDAKQFVSYMEGPNAPHRATKLSADDLKDFQDMMPREDMPAKPTKVGADKVAGMGCNIWRMPDIPKGSPNFPDGAPGSQVCITDDGIMLRAGPADKPNLVATSVTKGAQDPSLFALPAGYEVIDMGDCMSVMRQYAQSLRGGGAKPDQTKFLDCQKKMTSGLGAP